MPKGTKPVEVLSSITAGSIGPNFSSVTSKSTRLTAPFSLGQGAPSAADPPRHSFQQFLPRELLSISVPQLLPLVAQELAGAVSKRYEIPLARDKWRLGSLLSEVTFRSDVARRFPGRFESVSVVSSFYEEDWSFWPAKPPDPGPLDAQGRGRQTIVEPGPAPRIFSGLRDRRPLLRADGCAQGKVHPARDSARLGPAAAAVTPGSTGRRFSTRCCCSTSAQKNPGRRSGPGSLLPRHHDQRQALPRETVRPAAARSTPILSKIFSVTLLIRLLRKKRL